MLVAPYIAATVMGLSGWLWLEINGTKGLPDGVFVGRRTEENYNVATGGSTITVQRDYMVWGPRGGVLFGLPQNSDASNFDFGAAIKSRSTRVGIGRRFGQVIVIRRLSGSPLQFEAVLNPQQYSLGDQTFYRVSPMSPQQLVGEFFHATLESAPVPGGGGNPVGIRIQFNADGTCIASGMDALVGGSGVVGGYQHSQPLRGSYEAGKYAVTISLGGRAYMIPCFADPDPAARGNQMLIGNLSFARISK